MGCEEVTSAVDQFGKRMEDTALWHIPKGFMTRKVTDLHSVDARGAGGHCDKQATMFCIRLGLGVGLWCQAE